MMQHRRFAPVLHHTLYKASAAGASKRLPQMIYPLVYSSECCYHLANTCTRPEKKTGCSAYKEVKTDDLSPLPESGRRWRQILRDLRRSHASSVLHATASRSAGSSPSGGIYTP